MSRYLFVTWSGAGNQPSAIGMAQALARRGHELVFAGYEVQRDLFERHGFRFLRLERASQLWSRIFPERPRAAKIDAAWASSAHLDDVPDLLSAIAPDAVVVDCLMFGALAAMEKAEMPAAVLLHSAPGAIMPPGGRLETVLLGPVNRVREAAGRPAIGSMWEAWSSFPTFCTTVAELDPLAARTPPSFQYVGPVFDDAAPSGWQSPWEPDDPRPLVLVSFSSGDDWDQSSRIERTLQGLADRPCRVLVTKGKAQVKSAPSNTVVVERLPHREVLPEVSATVTHAGHGTVAASLLYGVPLVCLPNVAADQPELAARIASLGVGLALDGDAATPAEIGDAVSRTLLDPAYRARAGRLARVFAAAPGLPAVVSELERIAGFEERRAPSPLEREGGRIGAD